MKFPCNTNLVIKPWFFPQILRIVVFIMTHEKYRIFFISQGNVLRTTMTNWIRRRVAVYGFRWFSSHYFAINFRKRLVLERRLIFGLRYIALEFSAQKQKEKNERRANGRARTNLAVVQTTKSVLETERKKNPNRKKPCPL